MLTSAGTSFRMPISRLVAVRARPSDVVSMRMLLRMGRVVRLDIALETTCNACPKTDGLQVTFIADARTFEFKRVVPRT
jgi:hypothetical protein